MDSYHQDTQIKSLAENDRPREKFASLGQQHLSNSELLAILIGSGSQNASALTIAKYILNDFEDDLNALSKISYQKLMHYKGIGPVRSILICSALELGKRIQFNSKKKLKISSSKDAFNCLALHLCNLNHEEFWIILLNRNNKLIKYLKISSGGLSATVVDPKIIFKYALDHLASAIILAHNHPSGNLRPSEEDKRITKRLIKAGEILEIKVLDHLIIGNNEYFSFADENYF